MGFSHFSHLIYLMRPHLPSACHLGGCLIFKTNAYKMHIEEHTLEELGDLLHLLMYIKRGPTQMEVTNNLYSSFKMTVFVDFCNMTRYRFE